MRYVFLGLSITSSWGNGHATTYRSLVKALSARGQHVLFLERDVPWYAENRDMPRPPFGRTRIYRSLAELKRRYLGNIRDADAVCRPLPGLSRSARSALVLGLPWNLLRRSAARASGAIAAAGGHVTRTAFRGGRIPKACLCRGKRS